MGHDESSASPEKQPGARYTPVRLEPWWARLTMCWVSMTVNIPDELARRIEEIAVDRKQDPQQVVLEAIEAQLPVRRSLSFSGIGASGTPGHDAARRHREILRDAMATKTARDI